ncbi:nuclear transport factor 2 family protein [Dyadobacter sp. 3J3]|uniref:nuclear transport factor 2 family protein n=1 Tax=Dyadobacter sp. 3J3 TaxID=2606600 RepID=UPI00190FB32E|nr:nuclear transport factor 2 family protein [Dyadobacter sp. 3J3]
MENSINFIKKSPLLFLSTILFLCANWPALSVAQIPASVTASNKKAVQEGFDHWEKGTGSFFDLLANNMQWTITGTTPFSKTYKGKKPFMEEVIVPLNERLAKKIVPSVRGLYADGDMVIALWDGKATAKDGKPYNASYSWYMQMKDGKIVNVVAFLDGMEFTNIMDRIPVK